MDPTKNRAVQKLLFPGLVATLININRILSIKTVESATNTLVIWVVTTLVIFLAMKIIPQVFNHLTQK